MTDSSLPQNHLLSHFESMPSVSVRNLGWKTARRYSLFMNYPSESAVVDDVYGRYGGSSLPAANDQMTGYTQHTTQDQYTTTTHGYTYPPLQSPSAERSNGSPHSPPNRAGQRLTSVTTLPPLPSTANNNGTILNPLDYRSSSGGLHFLQC